jgi:hypothetical protein
MNQIIVNEPEYSTPHIRGSVIGPAKEWMIKTYGRPLFDKALGTLPKDQQPIVRGELVSVGWYPLDVWASFLEAMRREVRQTTGESADTFDRRVIFEAGHATLTRIYRFVFGLFDPTTIIGKMTPIFQRAYTHGRFDLVTNEPQHCVLRFHSAPISMATELRRLLPLVSEFMLHLAGQEIVEKKERFAPVGDAFSVTLDITYRKAK